MSREENKEYYELKNNINKYKNTLWLPDSNIKFEKKNINTWFDFDIYQSNYINNKPNIKNNYITKKKRIL